MSSVSAAASSILTSFLTSATLTTMFYYFHLLLLRPIYSLVSSFLLRDQDREILLSASNC